ncbi:MAG: sugar ABC transporter permease [Lachnospiraceae bacterium]|uniref:Sugar ABC transporter permease n=1 Tax=Candidatus Enterocloster excrementigallinarum TaxID=2838558 RepID=A0A9D2TFG5_9FIRM|nr:sugar ABC transporter permease [Lachnospiraceae bacterium]HJC67121.1 sugar ABC transporter permease [Candidatus Enterocloster excrementigallinarum]
MKKKQNGQAYPFLTPFMILVSIFYIVPAILTIAMSLTDLDSSFVWEWNNFNNYRKILLDPNTAQIVFNTVVFVGCAIAITILLDLVIAVLVTYFIKNESISSFFKSLIMIPMITPAVVYSVLWIWLLDASENGVINQLYMGITGSDLPLNWIAKYPMQIVVMATVLTSLGFGAINFSSAIKSISEEQFKAARIDGAGEWEIVTGIILPNIRYHIQFIALWETLGLLTNYVTIMLITDGGPSMKTEVWALSAYHKAFTNQQYGYGAAISMVLILVVMILMLLLNKVMSRRDA